MSKINKSLIIENSLIQGDFNDIGNASIKLLNDILKPKKINYFMTCPISRASETMAKCSISKSEMVRK